MREAHNNMRVNPVHAAWLVLESQATPMHMGALLYFKRPRGAKADYVHKLASRWREHVGVEAPWNLRLGRTGLFGRRWDQDTHFDLDYHFRHSALPAPGGERQMGELVSRLHSHPIDLRKPPWEVHLIEGVHGNRFALYIKLHPVMFDGFAAMETLRGLFSADRSQRELPPLWARKAPISSAPREGVLSDWPALMRAGRQQLRSGFSPALTWSGVKRVPRSALNNQLTGARRFATQQYAISRLETVATALASSVEDVLYYLIASALRRFFREYNALPGDPLVALVADRSRRDGLVSPLFLPLATQHADRRKRLDSIRRSLRIARQQFSVLSASDARAEGTLDVMPYLVRQLAGVDHRMTPLFNLGISSLSLSPTPLFYNGAELDAVFPMPMLLQGGALNIALMRYADSWHVGLCGARDLLPHLQRMAVYMGLSLDELEAMIDEN